MADNAVYRPILSTPATVAQSKGRLFKNPYTSIDRRPIPGSTEAVIKSIKIVGF